MPQWWVSISSISKFNDSDAVININENLTEKYKIWGHLICRGSYLNRNEHRVVSIDHNAGVNIRSNIVIRADSFNQICKDFCVDEPY